MLVDPVLLRQIVGEFHRSGRDPKALLAGLDITVDDLSRPDFLAPLPQVEQTVRRAMLLTGDPHLGLRLGAAANPVSLGDFFLGAMACSDSHALLDFHADHHPAANRLFKLRVDNTALGHCAVLQPLSGLPAVRMFIVEHVFAELANLCRRLIGRSYGPVAVQLALPKPVRDPPQPVVFGCQVTYSADAHGMLFEPGPVGIATADAVVFERVSARLLQAGAVDQAPDRSIESLVRQMIAENLRKPPSLSRIASRLKLSERTLRRRLDEVGSGYAAILDSSRRTAALALLQEGEATTTEAARRVGFSDAGALRRALKRWARL